MGFCATLPSSGQGGIASQRFQSHHIIVVYYKQYTVVIQLYIGQVFVRFLPGYRGTQRLMVQQVTAELRQLKWAFC